LDALFGRRFESAHLHMKPFRIFLFTLLLTGCVKSTTWAPRTIQTFDSKGQLSAKYLFTYNERGYPFTLTEEILIPNVSNWQKTYRISYLYSEDGKHTSAIKKTYDPSLKKWVHFRRMLVHYDQASGLTETEIHQQYCKDSESWRNVIRDHYIRNRMGQLLFVVREFWEENKWENLIKHKFLYNAKGVLTGEKTDKWNLKDQQWLSDTRHNYTYGKNKNAVKKTIESWDKEIEAWGKTGTLFYKYDKYGNTIEIHFVPTNDYDSEDIPLVFFYNHMRSFKGRDSDGFYSFIGWKGTAEYFRTNR
jgi:hypothetical protein